MIDVEWLRDWWRGDLSDDRHAWLRTEYDPARGFLKARSGRFGDYQHVLDGAAMDVPYDAYLSRSVRLAAVAAGIGGVAGGLLVVATVCFACLSPLLAAGTLVVAPVGLAALLGGLTLAGRYYYPHLVAHQRGKRIDALLPHATLFLFALVYGGVTPTDVIRKLADTEDVYGDVAVEFDRFLREIEWLGIDLFEGIDRAAARTPSDALGTFFEELGNVIELGGDVPNFLEEQVTAQLDRAEHAQERFIEDVETISEAYLVLVFAGPLFLFIILAIVSFFNSLAIRMLEALVYLYIPLGILGFGWVLDHLIGPLQASLGATSFGTARGVRTSPRSGARDEVGAVESGTDDRWETLAERLRELPRGVTVDELGRRAERLLRRNPTVVLVVTVPLALLTGGVAVVGAGLPLSFEILVDYPVRSATAVFVLPFVVATLPLAAVHEWNQRRIRRTRRKLPAALRVIADANRNGVPLGQSFHAVAEHVSGPLADELQRVHRDVEWFGDVETSLETFADRLSVPTVSRVVSLVTESLRSTNDVAPILDVVADDLETRNELLDERTESLQTYALIVTIGVLVFMIVVALFEVTFLPAISRFAGAETATATRGIPVRFKSLDVTTYHRLLFHAALVQAAGNGLVLGKLVDDDVRSGLKYANALVILVVLLFHTIG